MANSLSRLRRHNMHFSRPLIPCILAYVLGLWIVHEIYHSSPKLALLFAVLMAISLGTFALIRRDVTPIYLILLICMGATVMAVRERDQTMATDLVNQLAGPGAKIISGRVAAVSELADTENSRVILKDVSVSSGSQKLPTPGRVQLTLSPESIPGGSALPVPGETIMFPGYLKAPSGLRNFYGYDRRETLRHDAIYATVTPLDLKGVVRSVPHTDGLIAAATRILSSFREKVSTSLQRNMWHREGRLMNAMLFNDMRSLSEQERQIFRNSGTFHLFAVSGMHVAILGMALHLVFRALRMGVRTSWLVVAIALFIYLWIIGFVPSATRSYLMLVAFTAAYMLGREVDSLSALVFAVAVVVISDPSSPWQAGFILSVAGVAAVILFTPLWRLWVTPPGKQKRRGLDGWAMDTGVEAGLSTVAVSIMLLPLQLYYFGFWNVLSPLANLAQALLSTVVLSAGVITAALGLVTDAGASVSGHSTSSLMWLVYKISEWTAGAQYAIFHVRQMPLWLMLTSYGILFSGYYLVHHQSPEFRLKSRARFTTHAFCALGMLALYQFIPTSGSGELRIWSFDVGQGDSTLIQFPNDQTLLIDGGMASPDMGRLVVAPQLRALGIKQLDFLVATHDDVDHTGGLPAVMAETGAKTILVPKGFQAKTEASRALLQTARQQASTILEVSDGYIAKAGECTVEVLNPGTTVDPTLPDNECSIVLKISYHDFSAIFMGDAGLAVEGRLINEKAIADTTVLKIGHHGSASATSEEFVDLLSPGCALISCGAGNKFGHPNPKVMQRLMRKGTNILRTDKQGALRITTDGYHVRMKTCIP